MFAMQCPSCSTNTSMSLVESIYVGPFRCWKCKMAFIVRIENEELKTCKPISAEELEKYIE